MTNPLPPVVHRAAPLPSLGYGLYAAATITETGEVARHLGGVEVWPYNCDDSSGTYPADLCVDTPPEKVVGPRAAPVNFTPLVVYATAECAPDEGEDETLARAEHQRTIDEPLLVENAFATRLLADAGAPVSAPDIATAIGLLEEWLGDQRVGGYIHAARRWAAPASQYRWTNQTGAVLRSPLGHGWVFGAGYGDVLGDTLVATSGGLWVWRSTPFNQVTTTSSRPAPHQNSRFALSERVVTVAYECAAMAVTIDTTP